MRQHCLLLAAVLALAGCGFGQSTALAEKPRSAAPDKGYMQKIWNAWATLDPANAAPFYADGPGAFYDVAPLKYDSWGEYAEGVKNVLALYQSAALTVNDDAAVHMHGDLAWGTATIKEDAVRKDGKREMATFRWTVIWEKRNGKWLIVHDHVSEPLQ